MAQTESSVGLITGGCFRIRYADDIVLQAAEVLVQLSDEHSINGGDGGADEEVEDAGARQVKMDNAVHGRRRPRFRLLEEIYAETKPINNVRKRNDAVSTDRRLRKKKKKRIN